MLKFIVLSRSLVALKVCVALPDRVDIWGVTGIKLERNITFGQWSILLE
jgi:hypothetical protein